jgi:UDP-3-O-[3-hydroxymyristoyl] glucosamine N-acyltransferase
LAKRLVRITLADLASRIGARLEGDGDLQVSGVATLEQAGPEQVAFLANPRYRSRLAATRAGAVILTDEDLAQAPGSALITGNPYAAYARAAEILSPEEQPEPGADTGAWVAADVTAPQSVSIGPGSVIESGVSLGEGVSVGAGCFVGRGCTLGEGSRLWPNVSLYPETRLGRGCRVNSGTVIGSPGFGFAEEDGRWLRVPQLGRVLIGDNVDIGANTCIDRGAIGDTVIGDGVILDNLIQIAHNVVIGENTAIAGCTAVAGSVCIGRRCRIAGGVGIAGHLSIADDVVVTAMSLVTKSITQPGTYSSGTPLQANRQWRKNSIRFQQLDQIARRLAELEQAAVRQSESGDDV